MILMIDTNVVLDIVLKREPFFEDSYLTMLNAGENADLTLLSASAMTDLFYVLRKPIGAAAAKEAVENLQSLIDYADVTRSDIEDAFRSSLPDLEDALVSAIAGRCKADYIITGNKANYKGSKVPAITPTELVQMIGVTV